MDPYATHQQALIAALMATEGPVLELGAGDYSTPLLHEICAARARPLVTCDSSAEWLAKFSYLERPRHRLVQVTDWDAAPIDRPWGLVFVDHAPAERRIVDIARLRPLADAFVVHDTEHPAYGYESIMPTFKYLRTYSHLVPWTTLVSDVKDVRGWMV